MDIVILKVVVVDGIFELAVVDFVIVVIRIIVGEAAVIWADEEGVVTTPEVGTMIVDWVVFVVVKIIVVDGAVILGCRTEVIVVIMVVVADSDVDWVVKIVVEIVVTGVAVVY